MDARRKGKYFFYEVIFGSDILTSTFSEKALCLELDYHHTSLTLLFLNFQEEEKTIPLPAPIVYHPTVVAVEDFAAEHDVNAIKNNLGTDQPSLYAYYVTRLHYVCNM